MEESDAGVYVCKGKFCSKMFDITTKKSQTYSEFIDQNYKLTIKPSQL